MTAPPGSSAEVLIELRAAEKVFTQRVRRGRLRRARRQVRAVDGIDLTVRRGEMVGYLGPNGAGKSTTVKMLTGILVPTGGSVRVDGLDPNRHRIELARRVGVVFGQRSQLWPDLPLVDSFELLRHIYAVPEADYRVRRAELDELLDLADLLATPVRQLSLGQRMRGDLAAALLHGPELLYLDEPTIGLDVVAKDRVRRFLAHLNTDRGVTVLLTTHDLVDVERLCRRVVVIDHGRVVHDGDLAALVRASGATRTVVVTLAEPGPPLVVADTVVEEVDGVRQRLRLASAEVSAASVVAAAMAQADVVDVAVEEPAVDEVVAAVYRRGLADPV
ncbi:ATP-binding cassette domain-containing protein [Iamia sp. SCSIO 61187]|uniref:ABC transporter ATP-binding protein n=1 Tax=Iamia sp. SCSIO 61187 TaxID=2722752 RepID=UPI001C63A34F|nr:ATP-binding cassette domain-containing protein [Iamia sp. SCSIO 61187]QYG94762.1 ATP-binding cassette domain-containing protein [Iamia sp. SCSIO 61187]